jgi:hypothetical protein
MRTQPMSETDGGGPLLSLSVYPLVTDNSILIGRTIFRADLNLTENGKNINDGN